MKLKISALTFAFILLAAATACFAQDTLIHGPKELMGHAASGGQLYRRYCVGCHGPAGDGNGENAIWIDPKPRDFTTAVFKCRSTPTGMLPTDDDLFQAIGRGFVNTNMPAWIPLTNHDRADLVAYIKTFSPRWKDEPPAKPISIPAEPAVTSTSIMKGRELYQKMECWKCHGSQGHGDGPSAATLTDSKDNPLRPYNFAIGSRFKCGQSNQDLYRIFMTGLDGTPMPSFADDIKPEDAWDLVHFLRTLQPIRTLETRVWKDWTAAHPEEAKALKPIGPARIAQADDEAGTVKQSTQQIAAQASNPSSGSAGAAPVGDPLTEKSKVKDSFVALENQLGLAGASTQAAPQSSNTAAPEAAKTNATRPSAAAQADDQAGTVKQSTQQIDALASSSSSGSSAALPVGDAFAQKSKVEGASPQAAPQSSSTATPKTSKANAAITPASEASAAATLRKSPLSGGALFVQVGAFTKEANAGKLAESLRQENFPAFAITSKDDAYYLVHVGPYPDEKSARIALGELGRAGFKPFILYPDTGGIAQAGN